MMKKYLLPGLFAGLVSVMMMGSDECRCVDQDGDGYCDNAECDDTDPAVYPDAQEICDGKDNNCDGALPVEEMDADGDGYMVCEGDCMDSERSVYPGAEEVRDGLDNDCDGMVDEGLTSTCTRLPCGVPVEKALYVDVYDWNGEKVYRVISDCCDQYNPVYSETCRYLCAPDGGFTGGGDGKCPEFFNEAIYLYGYCSNIDRQSP